MSSAVSNKKAAKNSKEIPSIKAKAGKPSLRFAMTVEGQIIYADDGLANMIGQDAGEHSEFFEMFDLPANFDLADIDNYEAKLQPVGASKALQCRIERFQTKAKQEIFVVSLHENKKAQSSQSMQGFIQQAEKAAEEYRKTQAIGSLEEQSDLRRFLNMSHDVMVVIDRSGDIVRVNRTFNGLIGYNDDDLAQMNFIEMFDIQDRPFIRNTMQNLEDYETEDGWNILDFEAVLNTETGQRVIMEWRMRQKDDLIYCVGRDLTEIRNNETALIKREQQLLQAEAIGRMGNWHWVVGERDITWSQEIFRIFGRDSSEFQPSLDILNEVVHRRDVGRVIQGFQRAIIEENDYDMEFQIIRPGGERRFIRCEGRCEKDDEGDVVALYGIMQDMTDRIEYERQLKEAKDQAERAYAAKSQFLANMSHELRTPLNAIIGFSEMIQRQLLGPVGNDKYLDYIAGIRESGEHLLDLISDILDMSKIEAGKYELDLEELNVHKVIKLAAHMMQGRAEESGVRLILDLNEEEDENLQIVADRRAFMQVMLNLMSNAVKFTDTNGEVHVKCFKREEGISVHVVDNGIGIPANKLQCITNPFEQASSSYTREHEGTGLGLSITKELIEMHAGSLHIDSQVGEGTTVRVRFPNNAHDAMLAKKKAG